MSAVDSPLDLQYFLEKLVRERILAEHGCASVRVGDTMWITPVHKTLTRVAETQKNLLIPIPIAGDFALPPGAPSEAYQHAALYRARADFNAIIHSTEQNIQTCSMAGITVYPYLDDMAQIVGPDVRVVADRHDAYGAKRLVAAMRRRNAVYLAGNGALCADRSVDDAYAVCMVLEKASKAFIEAKIIGSGKPVPRLFAEAIRFVYKRKYAKEAQKNR